MLHVSTPLSITLALSFLSTFAQAKIYSDQLVIDEFENHQCRSDYRQLTYQEAQEHKTAILSRMQTWDIVGLESGWAIMGSGYHARSNQNNRAIKLGVTLFTQIQNCPSTLVYLLRKGVRLKLSMNSSPIKSFLFDQ